MRCASYQELTNVRQDAHQPARLRQNSAWQIVAILVPSMHIPPVASAAGREGRLLRERPSLIFGLRVRTNIYIDSFNLYYGCLKGTPYRWLDLDALCRRVLPSNTINRIRFFTARVKSRPSDPTQAQRQQVYFRALATIPHLSIHYGSFITKPVRMPLHTPPPIGSPFAIVMKTEEKGSDVNLATHLLLDGFRQDYEVAVVISGDTDLLEPIRVVRQELMLPVGVLNPHYRPSAELSKAASFYKPMDPAELPRCQFPPTLTDSKGTFHKPPSW